MFMRSRLNGSMMVAVVFSLLSCTTNKTALEKGLPPIEVHVLGSNVVSRTVASQDGAASFEAAFSQVLRAESPAKVVKSYVDQSVRLFYRSQSLIEDFDARLDEVLKSSDPSSWNLSDETYVKLMAARILQDEGHGTIRYIFARLLELQAQAETGGDGSPAAASLPKLKQIEAGFKSVLVTNNNSADRWARQHLIENLLAEHDQFKMSFGEGQAAPNSLLKKTEAFETALRLQLIAGSSALSAYFSKNQSAIARRARVARADAEINSQLDRLTPSIRENLKSQFDTRSPQSADLRPQVGPNGMMNGTNYRTGRWSLTFDDGPHVKHTAPILANLNQYGLKATFFWLAQNTGRPVFETTIAQAKTDGMILACHSYNHPQLPTLGAAALNHEIADAARDVAIDYKVPAVDFFRCPYGNCGSQTSDIRQRIARAGMISVNWNIDSLDWQDKNYLSVYARMKKQMAAAKRGIILMHDIHPQSVAASKLLMADFAAGRVSGASRLLTIEQARNELNSAGGMQ